MKIPLFFLLACTAANLCAIPAMASSKAEKVPIRLDPANPHYFLFRQKPTVLITSGEHYGAVMNTGFDYHAYLKVLQADGLNLTRVFTGSYREPVWGPGRKTPWRLVRDSIWRPGRAAGRRATRAAAINLIWIAGTMPISTA